MRSKRWSIGTAAAVIALVAGGVAVAAGPWPGLASSITASDGSVRYAAKASGSSTRVTATRARDGRVLRVGRVAGAFGVPAVTIAGAPGGLSADGRTLVLSQPPNFQTPPKSTRFVVLSATTLRPIRVVSLRGDFGFDALSPDSHTLYLIQHRSIDDASYAVRAYDLRAGKLLAGAIVDKSETDQTMRGFPVARATSGDATWVYTFYNRNGREPFIHALNTRERYAICVDLPWQGSADAIWTASLELSGDGRQLLVKMPNGATAATVDTQTLRVVAS